MAEAGFDVRFLDRRGSGLNGCHRGHTVHYERLLNDVRQFLDFVRFERDRDHTEVPLILMGISWGGKVAALAAARYPQRFDGLALLYPGICAQIRPNWRQRRLLKLGLALGQGRERVPVPLDDPTLFTGQREWQEFIRNDRYALHHVSLDFLQASLDMEERIRREASQINLPLLLLLAGRDEIVDNERTLQLLTQMGAPRESAILYRDARHTLEFEPNREEIFDDVIRWLNQLSCRSCSE
jgi:alpha-beta hydrolase superfamily lysophospholipase